MGTGLQGRRMAFREVLIGGEYVTLFGVICRKVCERGGTVLEIPGKQDGGLSLIHAPDETVIRD